MPTFTDTPQKGFSEPNRARQINVRDGAPVRDQPHPFLQAHGFNGGIQSFNNRVQKVHDAYSNKFGREPSPGLVWDVARSPKILDNNIPDLFRIPLDPRQARAAQYHREAQWNGEGIHVREDGKVQPTNLLTAYRDQLGHNHPDLVAPKAPVLSVKEFHKRYPMLADGFTGFLPFGKTFWKDVALASGNPAPFQQKVGLLTPQQALQVADQAQNSTLMKEEISAQPWAKAQLGVDAKANLQNQFSSARQHAVSQNKVRQEWLLNHDPGGLFRGLEANGIFDRNWMTAYDKWSRTPGAAFQMLQTVAQQNYFSPTPAGIKNMSEAAALKTKMANDSKNATEKWQIEATPLRFFADHSAVMGKSVFDAKNASQLLKDFWRYEDTGTSSLFPVAVLQGGFRAAKFGYDELSGGFNQVTADANGFTTLVGKDLIPGIEGGKSTKQLAADFATAIKENPDWIRVLGFGYLPKKLAGTPAFLDGFGNFVVGSALAMMMKGPGYWKIGEDVPLAKLRSNLAVRLMTKLAHSDIKAGDLWRAEQVLGPGASRDFIVALEKDIRSGEMDHEEFHNLATQYVKNGEVTIGDKKLNSGILPQLHTDKIPKSMTKLTLQQLGPKIRHGLDNLETQGLAHGHSFGKLSEAFVRSTRGMFGLAAPDAKIVHLFGDRVPGQLESFLVNHGLMGRGKIQDTVNAYIRASAHQNIPEMEDILKGVNSLYRKKFPQKGFAEPNDFQKMLETENLTYFRFAGGGLKNPNNVWDRVSNGVTQLNNFFSRAGYYWRRFTLATGPGLFYKHLARDSMAAFMGGMKFKATAEMENAMKTAEDVMRSNPELRRAFSTSLGGVSGADLRYMLGHRYGVSKGSFNLMEEAAANPKLRNGLGLQAATHIRRMVMSKAYPAFQEALKTGDMTPLVELVMKSKEFRTILHERNAEAFKAIEEYGKRATGSPLHQASDYEIETHALRNMMERQLVKKEASAYAKELFKQYKGVLDAGKHGDVPDILNVVDEMNFAHPGTADKGVAKFLLNSDLNIPVKGGLPEPQNWFDKTTGAAVSTFMKPNKFFRNRMFRHVFAQNYANMLKMGYDPEGALSLAVRLSEHQTMYHMLDFSNTLQFEQRFRGFLPFFTKHRLFVKWLAGRIAQYPGIVMPAHDIGKHLDQYGRLNFTFQGVPLNLNVSRLFWLSSEDMPPIIPGAQLIPKANLPGEFTRFDSIIGAWFHAVQSGWNYKAVTAHMDPYAVRRLDKYMAVYAIHYRMAHGESAPVSESEALKYALIRAGHFGGVTGNLLVNNSFLSPVTFSSPQTPSDIKKLDDQYSKLFNQNPAKARAFLDQHPEVGLGWGMTENFDLYNHVTQYWGKYDDLHSKFMQVESRFAGKVLKGEPMTAKDYAEVHKAQTEYDTGIQSLLVQDARSWTQNAGGYKAGMVDHSGLISRYGPWGTLFLHDPIGSVNRLIKQFGGQKAFSAKDLHNIYGQDLQGLQWAIDHPNLSKMDSQSRGAAIQELKRLQGVYHLTGKQTLWQAYSSARNTYETKLIGLYNKAKTQSGYAKASTLYEARQLISQNYANPTIKFDGKNVKVLPFSEYNLTTKTPQEMGVYIFKNLLGYSYSSMTYDQKQLLGIKTSPQVDTGWGVFNAWVADYTQQTGKEASSSVRDQLAVDVNKQYPGFFRDYKIAHLPKAFVLLYYAPHTFQGPYGDLWKQLVSRAAQTYDTNKRAWPGEVAGLDTWIKANWPAGFVKEYEAVGGPNFLDGLTSAWG